MQLLMAQSQSSQSSQSQQSQQSQQLQQFQQSQESQQPALNYSFNQTDNTGNDFNSAYGVGGKSNYEGENSFNNVFKENSITGPVKNLSDVTSGDLGNLIEKMKNDREQMNKSISSITKPDVFDPMKSPSQMNNNNTSQYKDNFFF
jgi:hypothetical protein